jgi:TetR/AcrR family transcriptional repressor of mexJK operon
VKTGLLREKAKNGPRRTSSRLGVQPRRRRGRPKTEDLDALKARLVLVARQAFVLSGYGATSINAIARSARVSKNTLYARFSSKAALFRAIVARQIAAVDEELQPRTGADDETLPKRICDYINVALKRSLSGDILEINRLILSESHQFPQLGEAASARFKVGVQNIARIIEECAQRDRIPCRDPAAAAALLLCAAQGWYISIMIANRMVSDRERATWVDNTVRCFVASRSAW